MSKTANRRARNKAHRELIKSKSRIRQAGDTVERRSKGSALANVKTKGTSLKPGFPHVKHVFPSKRYDPWSPK